MNESRMAGEHLIVIPAFNEARTIGGVVAGARRHGPVLVVDDGSTDRTPAEALAAGADVLRLGRRRGKGAALRAGVEDARRRGASRMITLDGDGQHDPGDIPLLCEAARRSPAAVVIGGRLRKSPEMPRARRNACRLAGFFVNWVTDAPIGDTQSGFRSYPLGLFAEVTPRSGGFVLETELLVAGVRAGRPIVEVDISAGSRPVRPSRFRPLADGIAIGAYLAACVAGRLARDLRAAGWEVARVFSGSRRRARHAEMAEAGASYPDALHLYGAAISGVAVRHARARLRRWWRHPGLRRDALVLRAIALSPLMLAAALAQTIAGRFAADLVTPLVDRFYSQDRLAAAADSSLPDRLEFPGVLSSPAGQGLDR